MHARRRSRQPPARRADAAAVTFSTPSRSRGGEEVVYPRFFAAPRQPGACLAGALGLLQLGSQSSVRWRSEPVQHSGIFCYRGVVRRLLGFETA